MEGDQMKLETHITPKTKFCQSCSTEKQSQEFHKNKSRKDGLNGFCKECMKIQCHSSYMKKREKYLANGQRWREENRDRHNELSINWYHNNLERGKANGLKWASANRDKVNQNTAKRYAARVGATPKWLTKKHIKEMCHFYDLAADCRSVSGQEYHVDHIVPLQGKNVCGLHVPWNLQVLPADINMSKGNKYET